MSKNGIIIDIGFKADINDFLDDIKSKFEKFDFDDVIGLSDAFKTQKKEVERQLKELSITIDETINGKIPNNPSKQLDALNKAVTVLSSSMKDMIKAMPTSEANKFAGNISEITETMSELSGVCNNATNSVKELNNVTKNNVSFVDNNQLNAIKQMYKEFLKIKTEVKDLQSITGKNKNGNIKYTNADDVIEDIESAYNKLIKAQDDLYEKREAPNINVEEIDKATKKYAECQNEVLRLFETLKNFKGVNLNQSIDLDGITLSLKSVKSVVENDFDEIREYITKRMSDLDNLYQSSGGIKSLEEVFSKAVANTEIKNNPLKVPLIISTKGSGLASQALEIIRTAQKKIESNPLQVEVSILSEWKSRRNKEQLEEIKSQLNNLGDGEVKDKLKSLTDNITKRIDDALIFDVRVNTKKASAAVRNFISQAREELRALSDEIAPIEPEIILNEEHKKSFQEQLNNAKGDFKINVGILDGDETVDQKATKKELSFIALLKKRIEEVENAVTNKSLAFIEEENIVKDVVRNESEYLNHLYGDLVSIEEQIKDVITAFNLIPNELNVNFDKESLSSLDKLLDNEVIKKIIDAKESINNAIYKGSAKSLSIPNDQKEQIIKDAKELTNHINSIFNTKDMNLWTSTFIESLNKISNKIQSLFGNNSLTDMIKEWNLSDELMTSKNGRKHLRERAAIIGNDGKIYGSGTYDKEGSTKFSHEIINYLESQDIKPKISIHSHGADRIVSSSIPQKGGSSDLVANYQKYINNGIEKMLTIALNDIEVFDAKGFFESNKSINFNNKDIQSKIRKKREEITNEMVSNFYKYFEDFVNQYGKSDGLGLNKIFDATKNSNNSKIMDLLKERINPQELRDEFFNVSKTKKNANIGAVLKDALVNTIKNTFNGQQEIADLVGMNKRDVTDALNDFSIQAQLKAKDIIDNTFDIKQFEYASGENRDIFTFNMKQIKPLILEEALKGTGYKNNYQDYLKSYMTDEFIAQNPLELSQSTLSDMFNISAPTEFLGILDKVVDSLSEIKKLASDDSLKDVFNIKFDEESLKLFTEEIDRLIKSISDINIVFPKIDVDNSKHKESFDQENKAVDSVISEEIDSLRLLEEELEKVTKAVNVKTEAFINEGKVVNGIIEEEINSLNPLQKLEFSYKNFKPFFDNGDLESEAGAKAALSYYEAYKEALISKVNKKDLKQFTIGNMEDMFAGNYANYKKGTEQLDLSGITSQIDKYREIIDKLNQPEVINIINTLSESIAKLLESGDTSSKTTEFLESLNKVINNLSNNKSAEKIQKLSDNLSNFKKSIDMLDSSDNGLLKSLSSILEKGKELKTLSEVLKSTDKQIKSVEKALNQQNNYDKSSKYLSNNRDKIASDVKNIYGKNGDEVLYTNLSATKDGLVQVIALVKQANEEYKKYTLTIDENGKISEKAVSNDEVKLANEVKQWEKYKKLKDSIIPGVANAGKEHETFTPESDGWDRLIDKAKEFGIEVNNIQKIIRNVDEFGQESFQIFTKLSRVTVGMNSTGELFRIDNVLDKNNVVNNFKKDMSSISKILNNSYNGDDNSFKMLFDTLEDIRSKWQEINLLSQKGLIDNDSIASIIEYFQTTKNTIKNLGIGDIDLTNKTPEFLEEYKKAEDYLNEMIPLFDKVESNIPFTEEDKGKIKQYIDQVRLLYDIIGNKGSKFANEGQVSKLFGKIYDTLEKNSSMSKELRKEFEALASEMNSFGKNMPADKFVEFTNRFLDLSRTMKETGQTGKSFFDMINQRIKGMSASLIAYYFSLYDIIRYIRTGINTIKELDTAMVEFRKVTDGTATQYNIFKDVIADTTREVASTNAELISSAADWARLGFSIDQASKLAKNSAIFVNVGDGIDIDTATEDMISAMKAFNIEAEDSMKIVDAYNEVGNNFAISAGGIGEAMQRSASSLATANNSFEESIALITAMNEVIQDTETTGTTLKVLSMRLRGAKVELEDAGESTDGMAESTSKLQEKIAALTNTDGKGGFNILTDTGDFKSTYDIIQGIAKKWKDISDINQAALLELIAGKTRANGVAALLNNWEQLDNILESATNSEGSAMKENEAVINSIEGKIKVLKATLEQFWNDLISSDLVKFIVDAGTTAIKTIDGVVKSIGGLNTAILALFTIFNTKKILDSGGRTKSLSS